MFLNVSKAELRADAFASYKLLQTMVTPPMGGLHGPKFTAWNERMGRIVAARVLSSPRLPDDSQIMTPNEVKRFELYKDMVGKEVLLLQKLYDPGRIPLFALTREIIEASPSEEVQATCNALYEVGSCRLPFDFVTIEFPIKEVFEKRFGPQDYFDDEGRVAQVNVSEFDRNETGLLGVCMSPIIPVRFNDGSTAVHDLQAKTVSFDGAPPVPLSSLKAYSGKPLDVAAFVEDYKEMTIYAAACLIAALATPFVVKESTINKRASRGIGNGAFRGYDNKTIYLSRTRISMPPQEERDATGRTVKPHIRRGHVHGFWGGRRDGIGQRVLVKKFVAPTMVNRPESFDPKDYTFKKKDSLR